MYTKLSLDICWPSLPFKSEIMLNRSRTLGDLLTVMERGPAVKLLFCGFLKTKVGSSFASYSWGLITWDLVGIWEMRQRPRDCSFILRMLVVPFPLLASFSLSSLGDVKSQNIVNVMGICKLHREFISRQWWVLQGPLSVSVKQLTSSALWSETVYILWMGSVFKRTPWRRMYRLLHLFLRR